MAKIYFKKSILLGFIIVLGILTWLAVSSYFNSKALISSSQWVSHTQNVLYHGQRVLAIASNIELGQRGYSLTGNETFLQPYDKARREIRQHFNSLTDLTRDNAGQQNRLKRLGSAIDNLLMFSTAAVEARKKNFEQAKTLNSTMQGKAALDLIRQIIADFDEEENRLLKIRVADTERQVLKFTTVSTIWLVITCIFLIGSLYAVNVNLGIRAESEKKLTKAAAEIQDLYDNAPCGYHSLDKDGYFIDINKTLLTWLGYTDKSEVKGNLKFENIISPQGLQQFLANFSTFKEKGFVHNLEFDFLRKDGSILPVILSSTAVFDENGEFVRSRTTTFDNTIRKEADIRIRTLNQELEAFTYSVSHDLRAPLRSIDGYSRVLQEDYEEKLDTEGKRVIKVIMTNAKRMGQLIDDLLDFARLGRKEVSKTPLDMTPIVNNIATELIRDKENSPEMIIHPLLPSSVDMDMIKQVWINLISNAIKYSGKNPKPCIEVSSYERGHEICYEVKDNGVGFDMQYADKLFGVFQRLHKIQDFEGTGVGLAIVKRIVARHNGQVWAEGKLNEGAKFCFTIPQLNGTSKRS
jgi:PAS domain S-box-containing protein